MRTGPTIRIFQSFPGTHKRPCPHFGFTQAGDAEEFSRQRSLQHQWVGESHTGGSGQTAFLVNHMTNDLSLLWNATLSALATIHLKKTFHRVPITTVQAFYSISEHHNGSSDRHDSHRPQGHLSI